MKNNLKACKTNEHVLTESGVICYVHCTLLLASCLSSTINLIVLLFSVFFSCLSMFCLVFLLLLVVGDQLSFSSIYSNQFIYYICIHSGHFLCFSLSLFQSPCLSFPHPFSYSLPFLTSEFQSIRIFVLSEFGATKFYFICFN